MQLSFLLISSLNFFPQALKAVWDPRQQSSQAFWVSGLVAITAIAASTAAPAIANESGLQVAQTLTTPLPPIPYASTGSAVASEQYVVFINGNSDLLLEQVRQIEPGAFVNDIEGNSVIQVGRFNSLSNAQQQVDELAILGVGAQVQSAAFTSAPIAVNPPADYNSSIPVNATASIAGDLPPLPVSATSSAVEFGQESPFQTVPLQTVAPPPASASPINVSPPASNAVPIAQQANTSGHYIVVPADTADLPDLATQIVGLGAPPSLVQMRNAPRGPHVAVGPYSDYGIAKEWSNYLRDAGLLNARVHFE
ncbi:MAG: hypothetical protein AAFY20_03850 [Cyanobacteria bacterium J06639_14]